MMSPTVAAHNLVFLSWMLLDKFLEKTVKTTSEIADMRIPVMKHSISGKKGKELKK